MSNILNIALCLIVDQGRILLLERAKPPYQGWWGLPGGKIHFGERPAEAGLREAQEETGLQFSSAQVAGCATETIARADTVVAHFQMFPVILSGLSGALQPSVEGRLEWFPLASLASHTRIIPTDLDLIRRYYALSNHPEPFACPHYDVVEVSGGYHLQTIREA